MPSEDEPWEGVVSRWELWEANDTVEGDGVHTTGILTPLMPGYAREIAEMTRTGWTRTWTVEASSWNEARSLIYEHQGRGPYIPIPGTDV
jgi:hypothetical protein